MLKKNRNCQDVQALLINLGVMRGGGGGTCRGGACKEPRKFKEVSCRNINWVSPSLLNTGGGFTCPFSHFVTSPSSSLSSFYYKLGFQGSGWIQWIELWNYKILLNHDLTYMTYSCQYIYLLIYSRCNPPYSEIFPAIWRQHFSRHRTSFA
jgi:hypothetical protein